MPLNSYTELPMFIISSQQRKASTCSEIGHCEEFIDTILCLIRGRGLHRRMLMVFLELIQSNFYRAGVPSHVEEKCL